MYCPKCFVVVGIAALTASIAIAQTSNDKKPSPPKPATPAHTPAVHTPPASTPPGAAPQLPPGMTEADMQACAEASTPGPMHQHLAQDIGVWSGKSTMWMTPEAPPVQSECTSTITEMMGGRFVKCEMSGDMPGMGPFKGMGLYGYDNVSKQFQSTWLDNCSTGMMTGKGELASDGKTMTWSYSFNCPITKKPAVMREIDRVTGKDTKTMEMYGTDPKSGKEFKMMEVAFTRGPGGTAAAGSAR